MKPLLRDKQNVGRGGLFARAVRGAKGATDRPHMNLTLYGARANTRRKVVEYLGKTEMKP